MPLKKWFATAFVLIAFATSALAQDAQNPPFALDANGDLLPPGAIARLGRVAGRYGGPIRFLPDGKTLLAAGHFDDTIYHRDGFNGKTVGLFPLNGMARIFDFSPDGKSVAQLDHNDAGFGILIRDILTGKELCRVDIVKKLTHLGAWFSPDGMLLATSRAKKVAVWETATSKKICELDPGDNCHRLSFTGDSKTLFTSVGLQGLVIDQWEVRTGKNLRRIPIADKSFSGAVVSPDGKLIALSGSRPGGFPVFKVLDVQSELYLYEPKVGNASGAFSPDSKILIAGDSVLEASTGKPIVRLKGSVHNIVFSPDGKRYAYSSSAGSPNIFETATGRSLRTYTESHGGPIRDIALSPDGKFVFAAGAGQISVWDLPKRRLVNKIVNPAKSRWDFLTDGRLLASATSDKLILWDHVTGKDTDQLKAPDQVINLALSPDGKVLAQVCVSVTPRGAKEIVLERWDLAAKKKLAPPPFELGTELRELNAFYREKAVAFSPDGKLLAANDRRYFFVWEHATANPPVKFDVNWGPPSALRFSPDGRLLAGACADQCIVWDVQKKEERKRLNFQDIPTKGSVDPVQDVAFSPDGRLLATAHIAAIRIWDVATWELRATLNAGANGVAFTRDQSLLISGGQDSTLLLWDVKGIAVRRSNR